MTAKRTYQRHRAAIALLLLSSAYSLPAGAETLQGALAKAYASNPTLTGARAGQRATDENVPIQKAGGRPSADVQGSYSESLLKPTISFTSPQRTVNAQATLNVPIYSGGSVRNSVKAAEVRVDRQVVQQQEVQVVELIVEIHNHLALGTQEIHLQ